MFRNQLLVSSSLSSEASTTTDEAIAILSEFEVEDSHYRVISLALADSLKSGDPDETSTLLKTFLARMGIEQFSEIDRFTAKGRLCIIIETLCSYATSNNCDLGSLSSVLTERELQIAALVAVGKVNKQIAKQLKISEWTVATYLRRMFAKLSVDSRAALVYRCAPLIRQFQAVNNSVTES